ncbi:MAG: hypothetical protein KF799_04860 [Bdellovibrionales bacterium]|nr:hypothetical protein [Bdellovibrionales bacterium]
MQVKSPESILICCAGLGMGNASRAVALMESLHSQAGGGSVQHFHVASWGAGYKFLRSYQEKSTRSDFTFDLTELKPYSISRPATGLINYLRNTRTLRRLMRMLQPSLIVLDSDYHFPAYGRRRGALISLGQAEDVLERANRYPDLVTNWRQYFNLQWRERLDAWLQSLFSDLVLVPCFDPKTSTGSRASLRRARKLVRIPLIVRQEFLNPLPPVAPTAVAGLLLSGSELEKQPFLDFAARHSWPVLAPGEGSSVELSQAAALDSFDFVLTQGGLSSISECIARGRFAVIFPLQDHPEQMLNARAAEALGVGLQADVRELARLPALLERIGRARIRSPRRRPECDGAHVAARVLNEVLTKVKKKDYATYAALRPSRSSSGVAAL